MKDINLFPSQDSIYLKKINSKEQINLDAQGFFIEANEKEARRIIDSLKGKNKIIAIVGSDDSFNRRAVETMKIDYLVSPEIDNKKDSLKQLDSGLNHIVAKEAKRKKISIVIDINKIKKLNKIEKQKIISRIIQNVKICRKAGCEIKLASLAEKKENIIDEKGRQSFGVTIGMNSKEVKESTIFI
jgi:ribonuclease P/MRP protein subunit RPP1